MDKQDMGEEGTGTHLQCGQHWAAQYYVKLKSRSQCSQWVDLKPPAIKKKKKIGTEKSISHLYNLHDENWLLKD